MTDEHTKLVIILSAATTALSVVALLAVVAMLR